MSLRASRSQTPSPSHPPLSPSSLSFHGRGAPQLPRRHSQPSGSMALSALPPRLHVPSAPPTAVSSAASSVTNVDLSEGILLRDAVEEEGYVAESEETVEGVFAMTRDDDEERKKSLRDQLRRTLNKRDTDFSLRRARRKEKSASVEEVSHPIGDLYPQRQYFVITDAGKPVFVSGPRTADEDITSISGITSALISVFADDTLSPSPSPSSVPDRLRCINAGSTRISFLLRPPLYYVCVSKWKEPESVTRMHLEYIQYQILSVITASQLRRIFERRTNFDLRRLLEGAESFLHTLISRLQISAALCATLSSLSSLRLDASLRNRAADVLVPNSKARHLDILYAVLVYGDSVITLVRPKKHGVHPIDLHILLNALQNPSIAATPASWLPICLPKFNPQGFVHAYISFLEQQNVPAVVNAGSSVIASEDPRRPKPVSRTSSASISARLSNSDDRPSEIPGLPSIPYTNNTGSTALESSTETEAVAHSGDVNEKAVDELSAPRNGLTLVIVTGGGEFDAIRNWSESISNKLEMTGLLSLLRESAKAAPYSCSELAIPGLRHFLYKSRVHVQSTSPLWDEEYFEIQCRRRLITLYQTLHDSIHAKSGQGSGLKLQYIRTDKEAAMGWITQPFELYVALSPRLPKSAVVGAANAVARWVKREESKLFLRDAPIF